MFDWNDYKRFCKLAGLKPSYYSSLKEFKKFLEISKMILENCK